MVEIKCIETKNGSKCLVLVVNNVYVSFDREKILRVADVKPSELDVLGIGDTINI